MNTPMKCPNCDSTELYHLEAVEQRRPIKGWNDNSVLEIEGRSEILDEVCWNERIWCDNCNNEWQLPRSIDYV